MSMYRELVDLAVSELEATHAGLAGHDLDAALVREAEVRRRDVERAGPGREASAAIAAEVGYDAALVALCRRHRLGYDDSWFTVPSAARAHLEAALRERGVLVDSPPASAAAGK